MGHRLSKIYTRTGDKGMTGLSNSQRIDKDSLRIEAIGAIDELNSQIGVILTNDIPTNVREHLTCIQHELFDMGGELSMPSHESMKATHVDTLEKWLDKLNAGLPALKEFILPGGSPAAANCHVARSICRRAERRVVSLLRQEPVNPHILTYLNRLSDLLFVVARYLARHNGGKEVLWQPGTAHRYET